MRHTLGSGSPQRFRRLYRRIRYGKPIVVVSGLPRSGTSMLMQMLEAGGMSVMTDGIRTADEDNPKGYFEHERVKYLAKEQDKSWLTHARGKAIKIISHLLEELPPTYNYKVLFIHRTLHEVLASQSRMLTRRGQVSTTSDARMKELFELSLRKVRDLLKGSPHLDVLHLQYEEMLTDTTNQVQRIIRFLGGSHDVAAMTRVVDDRLYRNRARGDPEDRREERHDDDLGPDARAGTHNRGPRASP